MQETLIDLIRHGEPVGGRRYRGYGVDDPLSESGWTQMWRAVGNQPPWDQIITSPLQRCQVFADALAERHNLSVCIEPRFKEVGFGSWEGKSPEEIRSSNLEEYEAFYSDPVRHRPDGAEPAVSFLARVAQAYDEILDRHRNKHTLIVTHAGVIRAVIAHVLHADASGMYRIRIHNAGITRIRHGRSRDMLEFLNGSLDSEVSN